MYYKYYNTILVESLKRQFSYFSKTITSNKKSHTLHVLKIVEKSSIVVKNKL